MVLISQFLQYTSFNKIIIVTAMIMINLLYDYENKIKITRTVYHLNHSVNIGYVANNVICTNAIRSV